MDFTKKMLHRALLKHRTQYSILIYSVSGEAPLLAVTQTDDCHFQMPDYKQPTGGSILPGGKNKVGIIDLITDGEYRQSSDSHRE